MGNKLIIISSQNHRSVNYYKLTSDEQALLRKVWCGVENNPQFHGSSFFLEFCKLHPQYTKYFTTMPQIPINFDGRNVAKFTVIMETIGYLILDYHSKPKQLDQLVGYVAMVHKDMGLRRQDMLNFGSYLIQYLCKAFPLSMNDACLDVFSKYFNSILMEMALKMEEFLKDDRLNASDDEKAAMATTSENPDILDAGKKGNERETIRTSRKRGPTLRMLCGHWSTCRNNLVYGQSLHYWKDRKKEWDNRLKQWNFLSTSNYTNPKIQISTSEDEETSAYKSKTEDETASEVADMRISPPKIWQLTVAESQDTQEAKDELKELLMEQKIEQTESINVSHIISSKSIRNSDIIKLSSVPEDVNEILEESSTPRERRRARSYLGNNIRYRNTPPSLEFHNVKKNISVKSQKPEDPQQNEKVMDSPSTAQVSVQSARQRRRESREPSLP
ncbi:uncharacterized protein LOC107267726 isoform X2 [Cephus cinctus]|uniref:Uncharacterized protein LOC107267726 isoform X2 n=1 Tax=Cephus cinctus TaxID=211228 RepID=A0AAJ7W1A8_CEPCN|nr:uncharacterized protein LOC107267726 isoform X2 [Cephus cinctus]